jgi:hypothetical protein
MRYILGRTLLFDETNSEWIPQVGNQAFDKNLRIHMGRCRVQSKFPQALNLLEE